MAKTEQEIIQQLQEEKQFKEKLLEISEVIATIRDRQELFKTVYLRIRSIIPFYSSGLFIINQKENFHQMISDSEVLDFQEELTSTTERLPYKGSVVEYCAHEFNVVAYQEIRKKFKHPHWKVIDRWNIEEVIYGPLNYGNETIGMFCLWAKEKNSYGAETIPLFRNICSQLSVAVRNVLANEQLVEEKQFKETLLGISEAVASIQDRTELFKVIFNEIKPAFKFYDVGLFVFDGQGNVSDWVTVTPEISESEVNIMVHQQGIEKITFKGSALEFVFKQVKGKGSAWVLPYSDEILGRFPDYYQLEAIKKVGYQESLVGILKTSGEELGILMFNSLKSNWFKPESFPLFQAIADQLAVAVSNVLANERLLEEKQKTENLLNITETIANINTGPELVRAIFDRLQKVFPFDDAGLFHIDLDKQMERDLVVDYGYEIGINAMLKEGGLAGWLPMTGATKHIIAKQFILMGPEVYDELEHPHFNNPDIRIFKSVIGASLNAGGNTIGLLYLWSKTANFFDGTLPIFKSICDQLSVALNNIIANEQLLEEKNFSQTLLQITEAVALVNNTQQLYKTIFDTIKPVFPFDELGLFALDGRGEMHYELIDESVFDRTYSQSLVEEKLGKYTRFKHQGSSVSWLMENGPIAISMKQLDKKAPHPQHRYMLEGGLKSLIGGPLVYGGKAFGMLCFTSTTENFYSESDLSLFKSIAEQVSIALANILANEAIQQRNLEKSVQIALIDSLNKETDWQSRQKKFAYALNQIFPNDFIGFHYAKEGMYEVSTGFEKTGPNKYKKVTLLDFLDRADLTVEGFEKVLREEEHQLPFILEIKDNAEAGQYLNPVRTKSLEILGLKSVLALAIRVDNAPFYIYINSKKSNTYHQKYIDIFERIAPSFSQSLEKSMANEQVLAEKQFKETLLDITESIANINTGKDLVTAMFDKLQKVFPFDDVGFFVFDWEKGLERDLMVDYEYGASDWNQRINQAGLAGWQPLTEVSKYIVDQGTSVMDTAALSQKFEHPHLQFMQEELLQQVIFGPLQQGNATIGGLYFWSKNKARFKEADHTIFQSIASQLSVALVNVLANEQLQQENKEKQLLLEVSRAIGSARSIVELMKSVLQAVTPIFQSQEYGLIIIDEKNDEYKDLTVLYHEDCPNSELNRRYYEMGFYTTEKVSYKGSQVQATIQTFEKNGWNPICFDYNQDYSGYTDQKLFEQGKQDVSEAAAAPLKVAGKIFGVFLLAFTGDNRFNREQLSLFRSVGNQLATAVSKALADEDIYRREREKVLQVELVNTLNQHASWSDKLEKASALLNDHIPGDLIIFAIQPENHSEYCHTFERIGSNEYRHFNYSTLLDFVGVKEKEYKQTREMSMETILVSGKMLEKYAKKDRLLAGIVKRFGSQSWLSIALQLGLPGRYRVSFLSKKSDAYNQQDQDFLLRLRPVMQITIEKLLAYERIVHLSDQLQQEKDYLQEEVNTTFDFANMVGQTQGMQAVFQRVRQVAKSDTTVLILGETGTGKELIARALHDASPRKDKPLVKLNCAALPESLIESELFGHEKGAFTGALKKRVGKFELAHKGTIFLDEIGELPLTIQAKLLRVIQEKEFEPLGSNKTIYSDFRLVVATNRNLLEEIQKGNFRSDLYYRLNVFPILLPPLRHRVEDIPLLINHYGNFYAKKLGHQYEGISTPSLEKLLAYHWPGNIRELQNMIEQGILVQGNKKLLLSPQTTQVANLQDVTRTSLANMEISENELEDITLKDIDQKKSEVEKVYLEAVMQKTRWRISGRHGAAALLDVKASTLESRLKKLGIGRKHE